MVRGTSWEMGVCGRARPSEASIRSNRRCKWRCWGDLEGFEAEVVTGTVGLGTCGVDAEGWMWACGAVDAVRALGQHKHADTFSGRVWHTVDAEKWCLLSHPTEA